MVAFKTYGYVRVSSVFQHEDRQVIAMREFGVPDSNIVVEKMSGKDFVRPEFLQLKNKLKAGDILVIKSIDRLGRNYNEILEQWRLITKETKAAIVVIDMPLLDTRMKDNDLTGTFVADLVLQILSYVAESERTILRQRQSEGIFAAKKRGVKFGRPRKDVPEDFEALAMQWKQGELVLREVLEKSGLKKATFYRRVKEFLGPKGATVDGTELIKGLNNFTF